jgi:hypothetical protein
MVWGSRGEASDENLSARTANQDEKPRVFLARGIYFFPCRSGKPAAVAGLSFSWKTS